MGENRVIRPYDGKDALRYDYLANGDFIVAAILSGLHIKWQPAGGPNAHVAVSIKRHREFFRVLQN